MNKYEKIYPINSNVVICQKDIMNTYSEHKDLVADF